MNHLYRICLFFSCVLLLLSSCVSQRKLVYLQGDAAILKDTTSFIMRIYPGDIIAVDLYTVNPEAFPGLGITSAQRSVMTDNRSFYERGFVLDSKGDVSLPYIGNLNLSGLTISDAQDTITNRFKKYIDDPVIVVKKLSFKISVLGDVARPGLFYIPNEQITILEALAMAGDLSLYADRTDIRILRRTPTGTEEIKVDLTQKETYTGQSKFLYPEDVVYVAPSRRKAFAQVSVAAGVITSIISTIVVIATLYIRTQ